jgi:diguanylate cyclase (GGDEF)-like protein
MLPDASLQDTLRRAEDLLRAARLLTVESGGKILEHLTISMGVAAYPNHGSTPEALLREADSGLYMAKADGRDNVKSTISVPQVDNATGN